MKIVITGASGFLGNKISNKLNDLGHETIKVSRSNIEGFHQCKDYLSIPKGDILIHLGESNDRNIINSKGRESIDRSLRVIRDFKKNNYKKIIYASSAAVYGDNETYPRREDENISFYDNYTELKLKSEKILNYSENIILRLSNIYGPGMSEKNVISTILKQINNKEIKLNALHPIRDFIWIDDAVDAFVKSIHSSSCGIFNVGSGLGTSIKDLLDLFLDIKGLKNLKVSPQTKMDSVSQISLDITHIYNIMMWEPKTSINEGLNKIKNLYG